MADSKAETVVQPDVRKRLFLRKRVVVPVAVALGLVGVASLPALGALNERQHCESQRASLVKARKQALAYNELHGSSAGGQAVPGAVDAETYKRECLADQKARREGFMGIFHEDHSDWRPTYTEPPQALAN